MKSNLDLTFLPFKLLDLGGQNVFGSKIIWTFLNCLVVIGCFVLCLLEPLLHYEGPETWAGALEVGGPTYQWLVKLLVYKWYQKEFQSLVDDQNRFWAIDIEGWEVEQQLTRAFMAVKKGFKVFLICSAVAEGLMALKPMISLLVTKGDRELPITMYNFIDLKRSPIYETFYIISVAYLYIIICFVLGFDGLFLALCAKAAGQLVLLKSAMARLEPGTYKNKIPVYVKHHDFILKFLKKLREIFSLLLLNQFLSSIVCVCMAIYLTTSQGTTDFVFFARCGLFACAGVIQIFIYCFTGATIKFQLDSVSEAINSCKWADNYDKDLRRAVLMVTYRAQNTRSFKAGGMIDLDLQSFVAVLRMSFSFYTLMSQSNAQK